MTKIKFCGLRRPEDARHAEALGAKFGGVILTESPRRVEPEAVGRIFDAAPSLTRVGVVGREPVSSIISSAREAELGIIQLHSRLSRDEIVRLRDEFEGDLWSVIGVDAVTGAIHDSWLEAADVSDALLLDTSVVGRTGGTGTPFDWGSMAEIVREIERELPVIVAGGLTPENVADAIHQLRPWAVDVSSGVETAPGVKSHSRMSAFANAVHSASIVEPG